MRFNVPDLEVKHCILQPVQLTAHPALSLYSVIKCLQKTCLNALVNNGLASQNKVYNQEGNRSSHKRVLVRGDSI
jgi:hypothetical protein